MKFTIKRFKAGQTDSIDHIHEASNPKERPMALDVLLDAQETEHPDLAYRYGCRNGLCGVCTIDINGKAKLACRTKLRDGDTLSAMHSLPIIKDLVVQRDQINQQLFGKLPIVESKQDKLAEDHSKLVSLNKCIECYACLNGCKTHEKNNLDTVSNEGYAYGNPYSFLKIQRVLVNPSATEFDKQRAIELARSLGIEGYDASSVPGCGVGINLKEEVIKPLIAASKASSEGAN